MIHKNTVLIIGAGASKPFGFPTGAELRSEICSGLREGTLLYEILIRCQQDKNLLVNFREEFQRSGINSIDSFIAYRNNYYDVGRMVISSIIAQKENIEKLYSANGIQGNSDWYQVLWNLMLGGTTEPQDLLKNKIRFITFNYDRSLEQYLLEAIKCTFDLDADGAFEILSQIPIKHVYGSLGEYSRNYGFSYGIPSEDPSAIAEAALAAKESIKTIPSIRGPRDEESASWLAEAERAFILGFGFDRMNCEHIGVAGACSLATESHSPLHIFATALNLTNAEMAHYKKNPSESSHNNIQFINGDCLKLFREQWDLLNS